MKRPPYGLHVECDLVRVRDGDTIEVSLRGSSRVWAIRLLDCWCAELSEPGGEAAKAAAAKLLARAKELSVFIPAPADPTDWLAGVTFDRILGHLFLNARTTLSEALVKAGHATKTKVRRESKRSEQRQA